MPRFLNSAFSSLAVTLLICSIFLLAIRGFMHPPHEKPLKPRPSSFRPLLDIDPQCSVLLHSALALPLTDDIPLSEALREERIEGWETSYYTIGKLDDAREYQETTLDIAMTWVNATEPVYRQHYNRHIIKEQDHLTKRFRNNWNQVSYGIRSILKNGKNWSNKIYLLSHQFGETQIQLPHFLDTEVATTYQKIEIVGVNELYGDKDECLPVFNTDAIETQIINLPRVYPQISDVVLLMNEQMLLGDQLNSVDIHSTLMGTSIQLQDGDAALVKGFQRPHASIAKSTKSIDLVLYTQWLLNQRFSNRKRRLIVDVPQAIRTSVLSEALKSFPQALLESASQRFSQAAPHIMIKYCHTHYLIERQREILIWSYISQRMDRNHDGQIDTEEMTAIIQDLELGQKARRPRSPMLTSAAILLQDAKLPQFASVEPQWTSLDGPYYLRSLTNRLCESMVNIHSCFDQRRKMSSGSMLVRQLVSDSSCGDCFLHYILNLSNKGLGPLLPDANNPKLQRVVAALQRYSYTVVAGSNRIIRATEVDDLKHKLKGVRSVDGYLFVSEEIDRDLSEAETDEIKYSMTDMYDNFLPYETDVELRAMLRGELPTSAELAIE